MTTRRTEEGEHRLPPSLAVLVALAVYAVMPSGLLFTPRWLVPVIEVLLLAALVMANPTRITRTTSWSRPLSMGLAVLVIASNLVSLVLLIRAISASQESGQNLLLGAMQIWVSNVIGFALLFWELDRGGPIRRAQDERHAMQADWSFPQDQSGDAVTEVANQSSAVGGWVPIFVDYLYVSMTNSTAFSPTDTMPLTSRAKMLMAVQGMAALLVSLLVVARAVNTLTG